MDLLTASGAAGSALAAAMLAALVMRCAGFVARRRDASSAFTGTVMREAASRHRAAYRKCSRTLGVYLVGGLVFLLAYAEALFLGLHERFGALPGWVLVAILVAAILVVCTSMARAVQIVLRRRAEGLDRDAGLVIGHALLKLNANLNRVFHDVPCSAGIVDHVVAGLHGVYAVHVVARRTRKGKRVRIDGDSLAFESGRPAEPLGGFIATAARLGRECSKELGHDIHMRCVVAVPGWEVMVQARDDLLLVNERNISMLAGWKDTGDYLMNEDVTAIQQLLANRSTAISGPDQAQSV